MYFPGSFINSSHPASCHNLLAFYLAILLVDSCDSIKFFVPKHLVTDVSEIEACFDSSTLLGKYIYDGGRVFCYTEDKLDGDMLLLPNGSRLIKVNRKIRSEDLVQLKITDVEKTQTRDSLFLKFPFLKEN